MSGARRLRLPSFGVQVLIGLALGVAIGFIARGLGDGNALGTSLQTIGAIISAPISCSSTQADANDGEAPAPSITFDNGPRYRSLRSRGWQPGLSMLALPPRDLQWILSELRPVSFLVGSLVTTL